MPLIIKSFHKFFSLTLVTLVITFQSYAEEDCLDFVAEILKTMEVVERDNFIVRDIDQYYFVWPGLEQNLKRKTKGKKRVWLDVGAGQAQASMSVLESIKFNEAQIEVFAVTASPRNPPQMQESVDEITKVLLEIDEKIQAISFTGKFEFGDLRKLTHYMNQATELEEDRALLAGLDKRQRIMEKKYDFHYLTDRYIEDIPLEELDEMDVITDFIGALAYTDDFITVLENTLLRLKEGEQYYSYISEYTSFVDEEGFEVTLYDLLSMIEGIDPIWISQYGELEGSFELIRTSEKLSFPEVKLIYYEHASPPIREFSVKE